MRDKKFILKDIMKMPAKAESKGQLVDTLHNRFLLFHGTNNANVLSIIEQGLQVSASNASHHHGEAYG